MRLSKPISAALAEFKVLKYSPPRFDLGIPEEAMGAARIAAGHDFQMAEVVRSQTGLKDLEAQGREDDVENRTLQKLQDVQESAYKEAYELGLIEGRKEAFRNSTEEIQARLKQLDQLLLTIEKLRFEIFEQNESHLVQLAFHMAKRLAAHEISISPESTANVMRQAIQLAQAEENISVKVDPSQLAYIEDLRNEATRDAEVLKKVKLEADSSIGQGGCIVQTNYGEIDSRFDQRIERLWSALKNTLVKSKDLLVVDGND